MKKKSLFKASFEESLNLENDSLRELNKGSYEGTLKYFENGGPSTEFKVTYFFLSLLYPIGTSLLISLLVQVSAKQEQFMGYPTLRYSFQPFWLFLAAWLIIILLGKLLNQRFILAYRIQFHAQFTAILWLIIEINLFFISVYTPTFTLIGVIALYLILIMLGYLMLTAQSRRLRRLLYGEDSPTSLVEKFVKVLTIIGTGLLGLAYIINFLMKIFSISLSVNVEYYLFSLAWPAINIAVLALFIFVQLSHFLPAYYKLKYPEQYRKYEGKSLEEWYGKKYLKKHKELTAHD